MLEREKGLKARVLDVRWLAPLPFDAIRRHADACGKVVVVDECRTTGAGVADAIIAHLAEHGSRAKTASVRAADCYVPLGSATSAGARRRGADRGRGDGDRRVKRIADSSVPGRGSYTDKTLRSLPDAQPVDRSREELRRECGTAVARRARIAPRSSTRNLHLLPRNVSPLIYLVSDARRRRSACRKTSASRSPATSMAWYTALAWPGAAVVRRRFPSRADDVDPEAITRPSTAAARSSIPVDRRALAPGRERARRVSDALDTSGGQAFRSIDLGGLRRARRQRSGPRAPARSSCPR
jgi:hypothetical protein